ncbi:MAG: NAD(+) synthase, partial [Bacteroidota bacterium]
MKIALGQINSHVGNFEGNLSKMLQSVEQAKAQQADIICFPELAVVGYPPRDFLEFDDFVTKAENAIQALANAAQNIAVVVGSVSRNPVVEGKDLYNSAYFLADGQILHQQHKSLLPTYDIFDEYRYFEPASAWNIVSYKGKRIALTICEDIWNLGNKNPLYTICPMDELAQQQPDLILNISASPFSFTHAQERIRIVRENVQRYKLPLFYVNQVGAQTEVLFDGGSMVMSPNGNLYDELPYFQESMRVYELDHVVAGTQIRTQSKEKMPLLHDALVMGLRDYFQKLGLKHAILGLSGGIDSAVVAVLATRALGSDNVRVVLMPSAFSSEHSVHDARLLAENLGVQYDIVPIAPIYEAY